MVEAHPENTVAAQWRSRLIELPRLRKRIILAVLDFTLLAIGLWIAISIRYNEPYFPIDWRSAALAASGPAITVAIFAIAGIYRRVTRYLGYLGHTRLLACVWLSVLVWSLVVLMSGQLGIPRVVVLGYGFLASLLIAGSREVAAALLESSGVRLADYPADVERVPVIIFGAGQLGVQLLEALRRGYNREAVAFVDTEPSMWRQYVSGIKVHHPDRLMDLVNRYQAKEVLVAIGDDHRRERRRVLKNLHGQPVEVKVLPAVEEIASGRVSISDLRPLDVNDLLGRDKVPANPELLARNTRGKSVMVTGAGGSVGSELVRQLLRQSPRRLVLFDVSEVALYDIEEEVRETMRAMHFENAPPEIIAVLGSVLDPTLVRDTLTGHDVQVVYHAAAYKHVPIVEQNIIGGLRNNTFGTAVVAECARECDVELVVLISTDKAVRPTNVMGASKRLAELVLQACAVGGGSTIFTMVRFGNVLDSSGSVVKKFRRQIKAGGPVTVTHPEIIRYFMSIPEAAELVIQAGAMAQGGDVFVLDMGEPVRIDDLARLMIRLSGYDVRSPENPDGDIAIAYTGLRSGEKLYEELLIDSTTKATEHSRIWRSDEPFLPPDELERELEMLTTAMAVRDMKAVQAVLKRTVEGYQPKGLTPPTEEEATATSWTASSRTLH